MLSAGWPDSAWSERNRIFVCHQWNDVNVYPCSESSARRKAVMYDHWNLQSLYISLAEVCFEWEPLVDGLTPKPPKR